MSVTSREERLLSTAIRVTTTTEVNAPAQTLWNQLISVESWPEWSQLHCRVWDVSPVPVSTGTRFRYKIKAYSLCIPTVTVIQELEPARHVQMKMALMGIRETHSIRLEPIGSGRTRVTVELRMWSKFLPLRFVLPSFMIRLLARRWSRDMKAEAERLHTLAASPQRGTS